MVICLSSSFLAHGQANQWVGRLAGSLERANTYIFRTPPLLDEPHILAFVFSPLLANRLTDSLELWIPILESYRQP